MPTLPSAAARSSWCTHWCATLLVQHQRVCASPHSAVFAAVQVNEGNIRTLTQELLDYLQVRRARGCGLPCVRCGAVGKPAPCAAQVCDLDFKPDLTAKICQLVQRFAPDKRWYIDSLVKVRVEAPLLPCRRCDHSGCARIAHTTRAVAPLPRCWCNQARTCRRTPAERWCL